MGKISELTRPSCFVTAILLRSTVNSISRTENNDDSFEKDIQ
jgi:hypothetical protein